MKSEASGPQGSTPPKASGVSIPMRRTSLVPSLRAAYSSKLVEDEFSEVQIRARVVATLLRSL